MPESVSDKLETNIPVSMRDGIMLYADVYRPEGPGPFPVLLQGTPYDKTMPLSMGMLDPLKAAKHGYAVVIQDTRGRYTSSAHRTQIRSRCRLVQTSWVLETLPRPHDQLRHSRE